MKKVVLEPVLFHCQYFPPFFAIARVSTRHLQQPESYRDHTHSKLM